MRTRKVKIESTMAALAKREETTWEGEVRLPPGDHEALGELFRLFNRVEPEDEGRLESWGYRLPSLSWGDRVTLDGTAYDCAMVGWVKADGPLHKDTPESFWERMRALHGPEVGPRDG